MPQYICANIVYDAVKDCAISEMCDYSGMSNSTENDWGEVMYSQKQTRVVETY